MSNPVASAMRKVPRERRVLGNRERSTRTAARRAAALPRNVCAYGCVVRVRRRIFDAGKRDVKPRSVKEAVVAADNRRRADARLRRLEVHRADVQSGKLEG